MPSNQELQEINDQLQIDLERAEEELLNARGVEIERNRLRSENDGLRADLLVVEAERKHTQALLDSSIELRTQAERTWGEQKEVMVARFRQRAEVLIEESNQTITELSEDLTEAQEEAQRLRSELSQAETVKGNLSKQVVYLKGQLEMSQKSASDTKSKLDWAERKIGSLERRLNPPLGQIEPGPSFSDDHPLLCLGLELIFNKYTLGLAIAIGALAWGIGHLINSFNEWMHPQTPLGF